jgi:methyl-accepting chemotaxis protein
MVSTFNEPGSPGKAGSTAGYQPGAGGFFTHHGLWAPGVRLFRALDFKAKAVIINLVFVMPIVMLAASLWSSTQDIIDFAARERAGIVVMRALVPVMADVLATRNATRSMLGGHAAADDYKQARERTDLDLATLRKTVQDSGDPLGIAGMVTKLTADWQATAQVKNGVDEQGRTVFVAVTKGLADLLVKVGDDSNLVLDPDVDSFYLINAMVLAMPAAAENLGLSWGWGTYAFAKGGLDPRESKSYFSWSKNAESKLEDAHNFLGRAIAATPALKSKVDTAPIDEALRFVRDAAPLVETGKGDARKMYADGKAAAMGVFKVYDSGLTALDELLIARMDGAQQGRTLRLGIVALCLVLVSYLFYSFYYVTMGGLNEVRRHLVAMTGGDLTTTPSPWGRDEAAALMVSLCDMQSSLRHIVERVRVSSDAIVHASSEIASASTDLSARTERTAANLQESASSMEEISSTVHNTTSNVQQAAAVASGNSLSAVRGGEVISDVVSTMEAINQSSQRIGEIIGTIDGIAFQTNILALNAAVEAARAGEQGRGFAVVASEVRVLAQRSAQAAREIKSLITASVEQVETGAAVVRGAGESMSEMVANARRMNDLLSQISTASIEQSNGVGQVNTAVSDLDQMTQQNAALVEQTAAAASALKGQAIDLADEVARFKLPSMA